MTVPIALFLAASAVAAEGPAEAPDAVHRGPHAWGRWGADDERGAANLITPERVAEAAKLIRTGRTYSLAIPIAADGPVYPGRLTPHHTMVSSGADFAAGASPMALGPMKFADDYLYMALQGSTQWDALSHAWYGAHLYNGVPETALRSAPQAGGATRLGIENVKDSLVGRAVLIDVLRHRGGALPPGHAIPRAELDAALAAQGTKVQAGDMVLVRTGFVPGYYAVEGPVERMRYLTGPQVGLAADVVDWARDHDVAALAADNIALEVMPDPVDPAASGLVHGRLLRDLGIYLGEIWWLEELAAACAEDGRWAFFLAAQPLHVPGAVGSPLNPIAIK